MPLWRIKRLRMNYLINYSQVTKTFYLLTELRIDFRDRSKVTTQITEEVTIEIEEADGSLRRAVLGYPSTLLRKDEMGASMPEMIKDRVSMIAVYSSLQGGEPLVPGRPPQSLSK